MRRITRSKNGFYNRGQVTELDVTSPGSPEIFMNPVWTDDDVRRSVLEDIQQSFALELSPEESTQLNGSATWSHVYNGEEKGHYINGMTNWKARERRRKKKDTENRYRTINTSANTDHGDEKDVYNYFYEANSINDLDINHQTNCFTIINRHYALNSETSSEDNYADMEIIECNSVPDAYEWNGNANHYDIEEIENQEPNLDTEKRTVWIYSYRNRQEFQNELVMENINIPSMSTSSTDADEDVTLRDKEPNRVSSPIPSNLVSRLNLTGPSLSTVAEVTEDSRNSSSRDTLTKKQANSWIGESETVEAKSVNTDPKLVEDKSTNYNSVILSARERRRQKMEHIETTVDSESQTTEEDLFIKGYAIDVITGRSVSSQANMDIEMLKRDTTQINQVRETICDNVEKPILTSSVLVSTDDIFSIPMQASAYRKPHKQKKHPIASFPGSVEALHCNDWIRDSYSKVYEGRERVETSSTDAGHRLLVRNSFLLRSAPWADFGHVADSVPSLQISLGGTDFDGEKIAWWRRALRCMLCR